MKGIILAGGKGTRLYPNTIVVSKQLLPIYDKPMIYYPLSILMLSGIREVLIISTPEDVNQYKKLFDDGSKLGMKFEYKIQNKPNGIAEAFLVGEEFIKDDNVCLILGDNIFYGGGISIALNNASKLKDGAIIFGYHVNDPSSFGVVEFDKSKNIISIEEKPNHPKSNYAIPGLYFFDKNVTNIAKKIKPSKRGELEITSIINEYLKNKKLKLEILGRGMAWLDTGTIEGMNNASQFVHAVQAQQQNYIACIEEIAYRMGFITLKELSILGEELKQTEYGQYILSIVRNEGK